MATTTRLDLDAVVSIDPTYATVVGAANAAAALADESDASYVEWDLSALPSSPYQVKLFECSAENYAFPEGGVRYLRLVLRYGTSGVTASPRFTANVMESTGSTGKFYATSVAGLVTVEGPWAVKPLNAAEWTDAIVDSLRFSLVAAPDHDTSYKPRIVQAYFEVVADDPPVATPVSPLGSWTTSSSPLWKWSYSDTEASPQERYKVKVFSTVQVAKPGFDPNTAIPIVESGEVFSSATEWQTPITLDAGASYRAYIQVSDAGSGGRYSSMDATGPYAYASIDVPVPAIPALFATANSNPATVDLQVVSRDNLLTAGAATAEPDLTGITAGANTNIAQYSPNTKLYGTDVVRASAIVNGSITVYFDDKAIPVVPGVAYSAAGFVRSLAADREVQATLSFYDDADSLISTFSGDAVFERASGEWTPFLCQNRIAPANAATATLTATLTGALANEIHELDGMRVVNDTFVNFSRNPNFQSDVDADGVPDFWWSYAPVSGDEPTLALDEDVVLFGKRSLKVAVGAITDRAGVFQATSFAPSSGTYVESVWVLADQDISFTVEVDQFGLTETVALTAGEWTLVSLTGTAGAYLGGYGASAFFYTTDSNVNFWLAVNQRVKQETGYDPSLGDHFRPDGWTPGGMAGNVAYVLETSTDQVNWTPIRTIDDALYVPGRVQSATATDWEPATATEELYYRAKATYLMDGQLVASYVSFATQPAGVPALAGEFWLKSLSDPTKSTPIVVLPGGSGARPERTAERWPLGTSKPIVLHGDVGSRRGSLSIEAISKAEKDAVDDIKSLGETLRFDDPTLGESFYIDLVDELGWTQEWESKWTLKVDYVETDRPE